MLLTTGFGADVVRAGLSSLCGKQLRQRSPPASRWWHWKCVTDCGCCRHACRMSPMAPSRTIRIFAIPASALHFSAIMWSVFWIATMANARRTITTSRSAHLLGIVGAFGVNVRPQQAYKSVTSRASKIVTASTSLSAARISARSSPRNAF